MSAAALAFTEAIAQEGRVLLGCVVSWGGLLYLPAFLPAYAAPVLLLCVVLLQLDDIKQFRQWDSKTPGHPENFLTPGVEVTTGECWVNNLAWRLAGECEGARRQLRVQGSWLRSSLQHSRWWWAHVVHRPASNNMTWVHSRSAWVTE